MKTLTIYGLTAILLLGLTASASAQEGNRPVFRSGWSREGTHTFVQDSEAMQQSEKVRLRQAIVTAWNDDGTNFNEFLGLLHRDDFREGAGVSKEQFQTVWDIAIQPTQISLTHDPVLGPFQQELDNMRRSTPDFWENAPAETQQTYRELERQMMRLVEERSNEMRQERLADAINENLTPEQINKFREYQISVMSESQFIFPIMFEALGLSNEQRIQLGDIKKEMGAEFDKYVGDAVDAQWQIFLKRMDELKKRTAGVTDVEEKMEITSDRTGEIMATVRKSHPDLFRKLDATTESGKKLADNLKIKMYDVLTDEQWARLQELVDNPPDYVRTIIAEKRKAREKASEDVSKTGGWVPGPNSWQPGQGIPEGYRQERNNRFPSGEN